jgi:hypothetical protein
MEDEADKFRLEQFCANYAFGVPIPQALRTAGYEVHSISFGHSLLRDPSSQVLIDAHRTWIKEKLTFSLEQVAQQLDRDREFAYQQENPAAAVSATMNKAKLLGYLEQKGNVPKKITIEWDDSSQVEV